MSSQKDMLQDVVSRLYLKSSGIIRAQKPKSRNRSKRNAQNINEDDIRPGFASAINVMALFKPIENRNTP